jgi:predicted PurR-regulated permease PerM
MEPQTKAFTFDRAVRIILTAAFVFGLIRLADYLSDVLIPFAVALLLAYLINPLVEWVQKKISRRAPAVLVSLFMVIVAVVVLWLLIVPAVTDEIAKMGALLSKLANDADLAERAATYLPADLWQTIKDFLTRPEIRDFFKSEKFWKGVQVAFSKLLPGAWGLITGTASFIMGLFGLAVIGLYLVFLLLDYDNVRRGAKALIPPAYRESVVGFVDDFESAMSRYFRGQAVVAAICGVLFAVGFVLVGLPLGILLGLFIGLLNMVPYLQLIGVIPAVLLSLVHAVETGTNPWLVLALTGAVFLVVQAIQDLLLVPKIMGDVTGLNPAMIMLSLSVWGKLLGLLGLIVALPMTYLLLVYYRRFLARHPAQPGI